MSTATRLTPGRISARLGNREADGLRGLEVDDEVEPVDLLDGQVPGVGNQQNAVDGLGGEPADGVKALAINGAAAQDREPQFRHLQRGPRPYHAAQTTGSRSSHQERATSSSQGRSMQRLWCRAGGAPHTVPKRALLDGP
jgi:hypothetical protein